MSSSSEDFFHTLRVRYSEIDAQAVVFNAHYLTYFDTSLNEYMRYLKYDYKEELIKNGLDFVVTRSLIEYKSPARFDEELNIFIKPGVIKPASIQWNLEVRKKEDGTLICTGELTWAFLNLESRTPARLPEVFKNLRK
ncbi:acyl-CoA thioester hydrolase, YbgC/YbaW family [Leptospira inadai serovar Lyme str. 10]|uniref:Acyl-CoA thioester hydrolase, YbgC/YbaW family n=2 Tax=Leptospira inadai serovar Lyme TaxID=293084 RepID=V6H9T9_9LEPT|nr:thioesterase family protein [Leptospira inadai]EQA34988.1 acyl-CoA thioester hydrolase, YbgC/YbaW family [Leptospira inadai serovar Lyme str. 10]PNV75293.1 acyl-CoA thioesterase [Leptospira inadai serovar Lyme]